MTPRERATTWALACALSAFSLAGCSASDKSLTSPEAALSQPGRLVVTIAGLPAGVDASVVVQGPGEYSATLTRSQTLSGLVPGSYGIIAHAVKSLDGDGFAAAPMQSVDVTSGGSTDQTVGYLISTGSLAIRFSGLPEGASPSIVVTGPMGQVATVSRDTTLRGLVEGAYTIAAQPVIVGASEYRAGNTMRVHVSAANDALPVFLRYSSNTILAELPNVTIDGLHIQQVVQRYDGSVPLVSGRAALLRVFVTGNSATLPAVRVRLYHGNALVLTSMVGPAASWVPRTADVSALASSWNLKIPEHLVVPGLRVLADVDPTNEIREADEGDNTFPATGSARAFDVRTVPPLAVRFVPVTQASTGLTGSVNMSNAAAFLKTAQKLLPLGDVRLELRENFTSNAPRLTASDDNKAWSHVLSEINALRAAEGAAMHYAGIVRTTYSSGTAGMGYVPGKALVAWDKPGSAPDVLAHELGHNFGRRHSPCGGASSPDPGFPYAGGVTGSYGYDVATGTLKPPTLRDLMGYCAPTWISDYTYTAILNQRGSSSVASYQLSDAGSSRRGLLVWGRISAGVPLLEPAFEVDAPALLPETAGPNRLSVRNASGRTLVDLSFAAIAVADGDESEEHFAFVVPVDLLGGQTASSIEITTSAGLRSSESMASTRATPAFRTTSAAPGRVAIEWDDESVRGVLVRNPRTGRILAFGRNGAAIVDSQERELDLVVSGRLPRTGSRVRLKVE